MNFINKMLNVSLLLLLSNYLHSMECSMAAKDDGNAVVELINKHAFKDACDSLVILPERFRREYIDSLIRKNRLFIAHQNQKVIGIKKLFVIDNVQEREEILNSEIRATRSNLLVQGVFTPDNQFQPFDATAKYDPKDVYIYTGLDYTQPDFRGQGINGFLYAFACNTIKDEVRKYIDLYHPHAIHMLYGLVKKNGPHGGIEGRTPSILASFRAMLQALGLATDKITFHSYQAYMPTFDPEAQKCVPLPDDKSIEGSGCVLTYNIPG